jgi:hypothetical protein
MGVLSNVKAEPTDPVRGFLNDIFDVVGFPRPEEALGTPTDVVHLAKLPTVKEWLPMPIDVWAKMSAPIRRSMPAFPAPPNPSRLMDLLPRPGMAGPLASLGGAEARGETGAENANPKQ